MAGDVTLGWMKSRYGLTPSGSGSAVFSKIQLGSTALPATTLLLGTGTSSTPNAIGTTAANLVGLYGSASATSGSSRNMYSKLLFGAAGDGEAIRAYGVVNNATVAVGGTVNGLHATLECDGASGTVSGAANAIRATFAQGASNATGGTCAVIQADSDLDNAATVPATLSYIRFTNSNTKKVPVFMNLDGVDTSTLYVAAGTGSGSAGNSTHCAAQKVLYITVNGAACYIPVFTQNS